MPSAVHPDELIRRKESTVEFVSSADAVLSPHFNPRSRNIFKNTDPWTIPPAPARQEAPPVSPKPAPPSPPLRGGTDATEQQPRRRFLTWRPTAISLENVWLEKWTWVCVAGAILTGWVAPFLMAFEGSDGLNKQTWSIIQWVLIAIFLLDMSSNFFVEYEDQETGMKVTDYKCIARNYLRGMLIPDIIFLIPWSTVVNTALNLGDSENSTALLIGLLRLLQLGRLYRLSAFVAMLEYRMILPQTALVLLRNNLYVLGSSHVAGCLFYLVGRVEGFTPETWIGRHGERFDSVGIFGKYIYSLYFALAAFSGLGDNDFYIASVAEACLMSAYLLFNLLLAAYILGTVTMLMVKGDKRMKQFRDRVMNLRAYGKLNDIPDRLMKAMEAHTELHFHNEQASDEQVLSIYPQTIRRRVLRHLYLDAIRSCYMFTSCSARFLDGVLACGRVEQFMPQEQVVVKGDMVNEVYVLLEGQAAVTLDGQPPAQQQAAGQPGQPAQPAPSKRALSTAALKRSKGLQLRSSVTAIGSGKFEGSTHGGGSGHGGRGGGGDSFRDFAAPPTGHSEAGSVVSAAPSKSRLGNGGNKAAQQPNSFRLQRSASMNSNGSQAGDDSSVMGSTWGSYPGPVVTSTPADWMNPDLQAGSCFGQISFFAEVPSHCSVWSSSVIKVLVISRSAYLDLLSTYPQQTRKVLENIEQYAEEEVKQEIVRSLSSRKTMSADASKALHDLVVGDKRPSDLATSTLMEIRDMLDKPKRALVDDLGKVKESLAKYVRKVDQEIVYEFLNSCSRGDEAAVHSALAAGMSPNAADYDKRTGLMLACHAGHEAVVRALLEAGADPQLTDSFGGTAMLACVKMRQEQLIEVLLEFGASLGMDGVFIASQLCDHIQNGDLVQLGCMLHAGAPATTADYTGTTPLHVAALCSNLTAVRLLVAEGAANVTARNIWGRTALDEAQRLGDTSIVKFLEPLTKAATAKSDQLTKDIEFLSACSSGNVDQVRAGLAAGQAPDTADYDTRTGLMLACHAGHAAIAKLLLQAGADPNIKDVAGHTAMWEAVQMKFPPLIDLLLQYGGSLCMTGGQLSCMMSQLVADQELAVLRNLIKAGAKPEEVDYVGNSPLHVAASLCDLDAARLLVEEADAIVDMLDVIGRMPLDCALRCASLGHAGAEEVVAYLQHLTDAARQGRIRGFHNRNGPPAVIALSNFVPAAHTAQLKRSTSVASSSDGRDGGLQGLGHRPMPAGPRAVTGANSSPAGGPPTDEDSKASPAALAHPGGGAKSRFKQDLVLRISVEEPADSSGTSDADHHRPSSTGDRDSIGAIHNFNITTRSSNHEAGVGARSPARLLSRGRSGASPVPTAAHQLLEKVNGLLDVDEVLDSFRTVPSTTTAARRAKDMSAGLGGSMIHHALAAEEPVNTAIVKRARRASVQMEAAVAAAELAAIGTELDEATLQWADLGTTPVGVEQGPGRPELGASPVGIEQGPGRPELGASPGGGGLQSGEAAVSSGPGQEEGLPPVEQGPADRDSSDGNPIVGSPPGEEAVASAALPDSPA